MKLVDFYKQGKERLQELYDERESLAILKRLASNVLQIEMSQLLPKQETNLSEEISQQLLYFLDALAKGTPLQYVLGEISFHGLDLYVESGVLIPRPETEELVNWILKYDKKAMQVLDIGVGSGAITAALGVNMPQAKFTAVDNSLEALDLARENCDKYQLCPTFLYGDVLQWQNLGLDTYDIIVSNPPYVREQEKKYMHENVLAHEPHNALFVPDDNPLLFYEAIANLGLQHLKNKGHLYFEINEYLGAEMINLLKSKGYTELTLRKDLNGKDRMLRAQKA